MKTYRQTRRAAADSIELLKRIVEDKRITYGITALYADNVRLAVYQLDSFKCNVELHFDGADLLTAARAIFSACDTKTPTLYVSVNTLGAKRVCSLAVIKHSNHEDATRLKRRTSAALIDIIENDTTNVEQTSSTYDAYVAQGKYSYTSTYAFTKD